MKITVKIYQKIVFIFFMGLSTHVVSSETFSKMPLAELLRLHAESQESKLLALDQRVQVSKTLSSDLLTAYLLLFKKMKLPTMVPLFSSKNNALFEESLVAYFEYKSRSVVVTSAFYELSLSMQIFMLLHELRHVEQYNWCINQKKNFESEFKIHEFQIERDADTFAATAIQCPDCLRCGQVAAYYTPTDNGYLGYNNYKKFIQKAKKYCPVHATYNSALNFALNKKDLQQVVAVDNSMGTLVGRVSRKNVQKKLTLGRKNFL